MWSYQLLVKDNSNIRKQQSSISSSNSPRTGELLWNRQFSSELLAVWTVKREIFRSTKKCSTIFLEFWLLRPQKWTRSLNLISPLADALWLQNKEINSQLKLIFSDLQNSRTVPEGPFAKKNIYAVRIGSTSSLTHRTREQFQKGPFAKKMSGLKLIFPDSQNSRTIPEGTLYKKNVRLEAHLSWLTELENCSRRYPLQKKISSQLKLIFSDLQNSRTVPQGTLCKKNVRLEAYLPWLTELENSSTMNPLQKNVRLEAYLPWLTELENSSRRGPLQKKKCQAWSSSFLTHRTREQFKKGPFVKGPDGNKNKYTDNCLSHNASASGESEFKDRVHFWGLSSQNSRKSIENFFVEREISRLTVQKASTFVENWRFYSSFRKSIHFRNPHFAITNKTDLKEGKEKERGKYN